MAALPLLTSAKIWWRTPKWKVTSPLCRLEKNLTLTLCSSVAFCLKYVTVSLSGVFRMKIFSLLSFFWTKSSRYCFWVCNDAVYIFFCRIIDWIVCILRVILPRLEYISNCELWFLVFFFPVNLKGILRFKSQLYEHSFVSVWAWITRWDGLLYSCSVLLNFQWWCIVSHFLLLTSK